MTSTSAPSRRGASLLRTNRAFYESLWEDARLVPPERFNTWAVVRALLQPAGERLEVAPGLRPRLPLEGTRFLDLSEAAIFALRRGGASVVLGLVTSIPFPAETFGLVCALDIVEHVDDEDAALSELARVAKSGAALLLSVPLHPSHWTAFDELVGHRRRYEPARLLGKLRQHGLTVERSAAYGMRPRSSRLVDLGMWWLAHHRSRAMWWYNRVIMPLGVRFQKALAFRPGLIDSEEVSEVLMVCRKR